MTKHDYICAICDVVRSKSCCYKRKVGSVFVNEDYEILATGYNNPPKNFPHCDRTGDGMIGAVYGKGTCGNPCTRTLHSEQAAIAQAAKRGIALHKSMLYVTYTPCISCSRMLVNIGVSRVWAMEPNDDGGYEVLRQAGIPVSDWTGQ